MALKKLKVGITGGIGVGKTAMADVITREGYDVINADKIAKEVMNSDEEVKANLVEAFGDEVYVGGEINTAFLADVVFKDKDELAKLNGIVHPRTIDLIYEKIHESFVEKDMVFVETAILYEARMEKVFDFIIAILADEELKVERVIERDDTSEENVKRIISSQLDDNTKKGRADFILYNNGSLEELEANTKFYVNLLTTIGKSGDIAKLRAEITDDE